jgi:hypothetical protein
MIFIISRLRLTIPPITATTIIIIITTIITIIIIVIVILLQIALTITKVNNLSFVGNTTQNTNYATTNSHYAKPYKNHTWYSKPTQILNNMVTINK